MNSGILKAVFFCFVSLLSTFQTALRQSFSVIGVFFLLFLGEAHHRPGYSRSCLFLRSFRKGERH